MMGKYTPGPWTVDESHINGAINAGKRHVALANFYNCHDEEMRVTREQQEANAQLISAAPDLLESLKEILPIAEIGAAKPGHDGPCGPWASCDCECMQAAYDSESLWKARAAIRKAEGEGE